MKISPSFVCFLETMNFTCKRHLWILSSGNKSQINSYSEKHWLYKKSFKSSVFCFLVVESKVWLTKIHENHLMIYNFFLYLVRVCYKSIIKSKKHQNENAFYFNILLFIVYHIICCEVSMQDNWDVQWCHNGIKLFLKS